MSQAELIVSERLPADASSAARARNLVRDVLEGGDALEWEDAALLAVSEVVTNALVHAGTTITLTARLDESGLRVEVSDASPHLPRPRDYASMAGTGRGLTLLDQSVDRWGVAPDPFGKVVWFEICRDGQGEREQAPEAPARFPESLRATVAVELRNVPLLMHAAWQEHASALLRELLLVQLEHDAEALDRHARASDALSLLYEQIPVPDIGDDPEAVMATAIEPDVSREVLTVAVPQTSVPNFETLQDLLVEAAEAARAGDLLVPTTQPEIQELRAWLCHQVRDQALVRADPEPWAPRTDAWEPMTWTGYSDWDRDEVSRSERALVATDERSTIVAVSSSALDFLGFRHEAEIVGRRVITIIPSRFRQAHIAGTTLHLLNGRSPLLGTVVSAPVVRADGSETQTRLRIDARRRSAGRRVFIAEFLPGD
jgi:PAS domain S-box-containing protein